MFCPNINDKKVKQAFDELKEAVGEIPAYDIWNLNQGLPIDRVPDGTDLGKPSKLFSDLLAHFNGNRLAAIKEKATAFSKSFKLSFGDWTRYEEVHLPEDSLVDINGEPLAPLLTSRYYGERVDLLLNDPNSFNRLNAHLELYFADLTVEDIAAAEEQLDQSEENERAYEYSSSSSLEKILTTIREALLAGLESRLKTIDMRNVEESSKLKAAIRYAISNLSNQNISTIENILQTIAQLLLELHPIAHKIIDSYKGAAPNISNEDLLSLNRNFFGFYCPLMELIQQDLFGLDTYKLLIGAQLFANMKSAVNDCKVLLDNCSNITKKMLAENTKKLLLAKGIEAKSPTIYNYIQNNTETTSNEISSLVRWLGAGDKINDEAVKSVYKIIQDAEDEINHVVFEKTKNLLLLLKIAGNNLKVLFETDDNGKPTSYIVRASNYGLFILNYKAELLKIRMELGIAPNEILLPENRELRIAFNKRKNEWLSKNSERKYTKEYYDLFNELSQEASDAREIIQLKIRTITDKVKNLDGFIEFERLTDEEWDRLNSHYIEKHLLASIYDIYGNKKEGVEADIANELTELNLKLAKGLKMVSNEAKFKLAVAAKLKLLDNGEINLKDFDKWMQRNTRLTYTEEFYELLKKIDRTAYGPKYDELNEKKRALLNIFRDTKTGEVNPKLIPPVTMRVLNKLDSDLRAIRKKTKKVSKEGSTLFEDIAKIVPTDQFKADERAVLALMEENPGAVEAFYLLHTLSGPDGMRYPRSYYTKIVPKNTKYIRTEPSMNFTELSEESPYYNRKFKSRNRALHLVLQSKNSKLTSEEIATMLSSNDKELSVFDSLSDKEKDMVLAIEDESKDEYMQPKLDLYNTFDKFLDILNDKNLHKLRLEIINTIDESNKKMPNLNNMSKYKMPQISGSMYRFMKSNHGIFAGFKEWLKEGVIMKGDDVGIRETPKYAPDGTSLNFIPLYFVLDLEEPSTISIDLVGGTLRYFLMAENYQSKGNIRASVEAIKLFLRNRKYKGMSEESAEGIRTLVGAKSKSKEGYETNIYQFVEKFINMNLYDVKTNSMTFSIRGRKINISKLLSKFKALGTLRNLAWSLWIAGTGFFTATHNLLVLTLVGRYYDFDDSVKATKEMAHHLLSHSWRTIGNKNYKSKQMALMDYFEVGSTVDSMFTATNVPAIVRIFNGHWAYGFYSLVDFFVKGNVLNAVMFNYKNVKGEFICKEDYLNKYGDTSKTREEWKNYTSAYQSIEYVNGNVQVKDSKDEEAWNKVKDIIGRTALNLGASADGTLNKLLKALISANIFGSMAMMHRQYIPLAILEKYTMDRLWDYTTQRYKEAVLKTPIRIISLIYKDLNNLNNLLKTLKALKVIAGIKTGITDQASLANLRQLRIEMLLVQGLYPIIVRMLNSEADEDKKNKILNLFAYIMMRTLFESFAPYNVVDIFSTIKNPTPLFGIIDNFGTVISYPKDLIMNMFNDNLDINRKIQRGAYKDMTPILKAIILLTPYKNFMELNDLPSKRNYYEKLILRQ